MVTFSIRFIYYLCIWISVILSAQGTRLPLPYVILFCACSIAIYFLIPVMKGNPLLFLVLFFLVYVLAFFASLMTQVFSLFLFFFYLYEASKEVSEKLFHMILVANGIAAGIFLYFTFPLYTIFLFILMYFPVATLLIEKNKRSKQLADQRKLYTQLIDEYRIVKRQALANEKAAIMEERTKIARDMHDSVGHKLTVLDMQMAMLLIREKNPELEEMKQTVEACLEETRKAVRALKTEENEGLPAVIDLIKKLESESHLRVQLTVRDGVLGIPLTNKMSVILYRILQESMTNVMKHSDVKEVSITLSISSHRHFQFEIKNPLRTARPYHEGFGLTSMRERVEQTGGTISFTQTDKEFMIFGTLPIEL
ncbi:GHKL domain-containing protein [Bacillaceae bacterium Marseille-Q3522]|nr:GHKL domain-containing protein [Bacillaceae bacterium Marseille-Q3522]